MLLGSRLPVSLPAWLGNRERKEQQKKETEAASKYIKENAVSARPLDIFCSLSQMRSGAARIADERERFSFAGQRTAKSEFLSSLWRATAVG